jgi:hypothetical protein
MVGGKPLQADTESAALAKSSTHVAGVEQHLGCEHRVCRESSSVLICDFSLGTRTKCSNLREQVEQSLSSGGISASTIFGKLHIGVSLYCVCKIHNFFLLFTLFLFSAIPKKAERIL